MQGNKKLHRYIMLDKLIKLIQYIVEKNLGQEDGKKFSANLVF